jgi:hypothetical protein
MTYRQKSGTFDGIPKYRQTSIPPNRGTHGTDRHLHQERKTQRKPAGDKHRDGSGMYLLVNAGGKYWRMDYRFADKRKTLALGVYPEVSLAKARQRRDKARELLADGIDPGIAKREEKQAKAGSGRKHL